jgi:hypothetical protein
MKRALEQRAQALGKKPSTYYYEVSRKVSSNRNYLWESFDPRRQKGSLHVFKRICDIEGINFSWIVDGSGRQVNDEPEYPRLDREHLLAALEAILENCLSLDEAATKYAALAVLEVVERPPGDRLGVDTKDKIRIGIQVALRQYVRTRV